MRLSAEVAREIVRDRVCSVCTDRGTRGCALPETRPCALDTRLPAILEAMASIRSGSRREYAAAIRRRVCSTCAHQDRAGACHLRSTAQCALDAYLILVIEALSDLRGVVGQP